MKFEISTKELNERMTALAISAPEKMQKIERKWLLFSANMIQTRAIATSKVEAVGVTRNYMRGWKRTPVKRDAVSQFIKIFNTEMYSQALEVGGHWKKMPPPKELHEWVKKKLVKVSKRKSASRKDRTVTRNRKPKNSIKGVKASAKGSRGTYSTKVKQIAFLIARKIAENRWGGKGQKFQNSKTHGKLQTLERAYKFHINNLLRIMDNLVSKALRRL